MARCSLHRSTHSRSRSGDFVPVASYREKLLGARRFADGAEAAHVIVPAASVNKDGQLVERSRRLIASGSGNNYDLPCFEKVRLSAV